MAKCESFRVGREEGHTERPSSLPVLQPGEKAAYSNAAMLRMAKDEPIATSCRSRGMPAATDFLRPHSPRG